MIDDLLHLLETAKGIETRDLWLEIVTSRRLGLWPHASPVDQKALQLTLFGLQAAGQVVLVAGAGWFITAHVPKTSQRRTFEEPVQQGLFT